MNYGPPDLETSDFHGIMTASQQMRRLFRLIERVADSDAPVLIRGETGTGKELVARALHKLSPRSNGPFQAVNCATLTGEMLASELFGHVKGAYTGAIRDRPGLLRMADGGTLFLDEIAEMPMNLQAQLLRVIQEQRFIPLGGSEPVRVDVRFLSATHQALREAVKHRRFREDLMYRVRVIPLYLPRLAERDRDVEVLAWHFIAAFNRARAQRRTPRHVTGLSQGTRDALLRYGWPGNVRELRNCIEHAFVVGVGAEIEVDSLPPELRGARPNTGDNDNDSDNATWTPSHTMGTKPSPQQLRRAHIEAALNATGWRKTQAAEMLGISRSTLWRNMRDFGIER